MLRFPKTINRFLIRLTIVLIAACGGLYAGLSKSSTEKPIKKTQKIVNKISPSISTKTPDLLDLKSKNILKLN